MATKYYIDKQEMYDEIVKSHEIGKCTENLGKMFMLLCEKYSHHYYFKDYGRKYGRAFKEDLISCGLHACLKAWDKFGLEFNNPFSFFTTCIFRAYIGYLAKEYKQGNIKNALKLDAGLNADYGYEEMMRDSEKDEEDVYEGSIDPIERKSSFEQPNSPLDADPEVEDTEQTTPTADDEDVEVTSEDVDIDSEIKTDYTSDGEEDTPVRTVRPDINDHISGMTLWGEDDVDDEPLTKRLFGV